jgi:anti-anti-sigma factor
VTVLPSPFELHVEDNDGTRYLRMIGEFDLAGVGSVEAELDRIRAAETRRVVFDLQGVTFLDLAGLRTILRANDRALSESFDLIVVRPRGHANRVFTLTRAGQELVMLDRAPRPGADEVDGGSRS